MRLTILLLMISSICFGQLLKQPKGVMWFWEYSNNCSDCPVVIFLPGSGERSDAPNLTLIQRQGLPKLMKAKGLIYLDSIIVLVPQQTTSASGYVRDPSNSDIIKFLQYVKVNYKSEYRLVTGLSMGADGSWDASYRGIDTLVTAIVPVSGKGDYNGAKITEKRNIKVWGIHGDADYSVPISDGKRPINGMISVGGNPKWTVIKGGGHNSSTWDVAFSITDRPELGGTTIYKWFLSMVKPIEMKGIFVDGIFCGTDSCRVDNHLITIKN